MKVFGNQKAQRQMNTGKKNKEYENLGMLKNDEVFEDE